MADNNPFVPNVHFELIPIKNLVSNQDYQRPLSESHIRKALEEFDVYQINPVKVSRRDGINYVFDGQHTIEIVASESGSRETPVWCMIYDDLKYTEEAHIFADQQKHVKNLVPYETFVAHIEAGDEKQKMVLGRCWSSVCNRLYSSILGISDRYLYNYRSCWNRLSAGFCGSAAHCYDCGWINTTCQKSCERGAGKYYS